jgi:serine/threonine protein kinase
LKDIIEKSELLSNNDVMFYFIMMLLALHYFQTVEILHRDLKPENILIDILQSDFKIIKIADFGLSKRANSMKG